MSEYQSILTEVDGSVGILTLNKPQRHNAFDEQLIAEITAGLRELAATRGCARGPVVYRQELLRRRRPAVDEARGRLFGSGKPARRQAARRVDVDLNELAKPTIARVQGPAYGGGVGLIAACDIAVGTYDALFALSEVKLGIVPAVISPYVLAAIGERYCRRYMLTAERFSAAEAYRIGLLHELVPGEEQLDEAIAEIIDSLLANGPQAQAACKSLIRIVAGQPIDEETIDETAQRITRVRASPEGREGLAAFLEKRPPNWVAD
jgi:methylglutaconyl-CoA hydratase